MSHDFIKKDSFRMTVLNLITQKYWPKKVQTYLTFSFILNLTFNITFAQNNIFLSPQTYNLEKFLTLEERFVPPSGFKRIDIDSSSFANYLRNLPSVDENHNVLDFKNNIRVKAGDSSFAAIVPITISDNRLWQCMDIILLFKVDYWKKKNTFNLIDFPLPDGTNLSWQEWRSGIRPEFSGSHFYKKRKAVENDSEKNLKKYLNTIFSYSNTQTFYHYYPQAKIDLIKPGDFIVKKGKKGHAVLIVDIAINDHNEKVALIGQGDTPACQFYLLKNKDGSAWFKISELTEFPQLPIRKKMYWPGLRRFPQ